MIKTIFIWLTAITSILLLLGIFLWWLVSNILKDKKSYGNELTTWSFIDCLDRLFANQNPKTTLPEGYTRPKWLKRDF